MSQLKSLVVLAVLVLALSPALWASELEEHFFDSDGVKIRYVIKGQGEPLVLIHGFTANVETNWILPGILDKLAEGFQVIALDARGHGKSDKPHDPAAYGAHMVDDVIRLLDHLEIEKAHIGGYSMGGFLTMRILATHPERMLSAIVGAAGWSDVSLDDSMLEELAASLERGEGIAPLLEALTPEGEPRMTDELIQLANNMVMGSNDQMALAAVARGLSEIGVTKAQLEANQVPTLAIIGSKDPLKVGVDAMAPVMKSLEIKLIDGGDHITTLMNPALAAQFAEGVLEFLIAACKCA